MLSSIYDYTTFGVIFSGYRYSVFGHRGPAYLTVVTLFQVFVDATYLLLTTTCK